MNSPICSALARASRGARSLGLFGALAACTPTPDAPDLAEIYASVAERTGPGENALVTVPGTLGSRLVERGSGRVLWGGRGGELSADPDTPGGARLIALPVIPDDAPFSKLRDDVRPAGILDRAEASVLGIPVIVDVYSGALDLLAKGGFVADSPAEDRPAPPPGTPPSFADYQRILADDANSFQFSYDWRRDIPALARAFHRFVRERKRKVAAIRSLHEGRSVAPEDVRLDLLAHSMGAIVARYYLMHGAADLGESGALPPLTWAGAEHFRRVVFVAPPNAGSILAVENLVKGEQFGPLQPRYPAALLATHPSVWQLFPRARHGRLHLKDQPGTTLDPLDPRVWERFGWGLLERSAEGRRIRRLLLPELPNDAARRERAGAHQARLMRRARRFQRAMDRWSPPPRHLEIFLVVGGGFETPASASVAPETGAFEISGRENGDGVVLRASALLDERQGPLAAPGFETPLDFDTTLFLPDEHVALTANPVFGDNLLFWLLEAPRRRERLAEPRTAAPGEARDPGRPAQPGTDR